MYVCMSSSLSTFCLSAVVGMYVSTKICIFACINAYPHVCGKRILIVVVSILPYASQYIYIYVRMYVCLIQVYVCDHSSYGWWDIMIF